MKTRKDLVQEVITAINAQDYLEIGMATGYTFNHVQVPRKVSVDTIRDTHATHIMTSDEFFRKNVEMFDVIFIDGYHEASQVMRDINNSLQFLRPNGVIILHDTLPLSLISIDRSLCWSAWEAVATLRMTNPNVFVASVILSDDPVGCGIVRHGKQELFPTTPLTYDNYVQNRDKWMNVIDPDEYIKTLS